MLPAVRAAKQRPKRPTVASRQAPRASRRWAAPLLIVVVGLAAYANSLNGPFLFDDEAAISNNRSIRHLGSITAVLHPDLQSPVTGRPLANLSFALNYAIGGFRVEDFHAVNVTIHILAALILLGVLRRTFKRTSLMSRCPPGLPLALFCTLVWTVHPLNTEAVDYLTQRTELMMGLFYLLALYAAIRSSEAASARRWEWVAAASAVCSVASKETALTLPLVIALWDRAFAYPSLREAWAHRRRLYALVAGSWLLFALFAPELPFFARGGFKESVSPATYLLNQAPMIVQYLKLTVWPRQLILDYGPVQPATLGAVWPAVLIVMMLVAATGAALFRLPSVGFWGAWFLVTLAPASSVIPIPTEMGAERRMYLPLVGVIVLLALGGNLLFERLTSPLVRRRAVWATGAGVLIVMGALTIRRNVDYQSELAIWQTVVDRRPQARARETLSMYLRDAGRHEEAIAHLRVAAADSPKARHMLASALLNRGDLAGSIAQFRQFIVENPRSPELTGAREEFATALILAGDTRGALEQFRAITSAAPGYARGHVGLADAFASANDIDDAVAEYRAALRLQPDNVVALASLGQLLASRGEDDEAMRLLRRALEFEPGALPPRRELVRRLIAQRNLVDAEKQARQLIAFAPSDADAHNLLGIVLASEQRFGPASDQFQEALRLDPSNSDAAANLTRLTHLVPQVRGRQ